VLCGHASEIVRVMGEHLSKSSMLIVTYVCGRIGSICNSKGRIKDVGGKF
jgi:hypothetical protein